MEEAILMVLFLGWSYACYFNGHRAGERAATEAAHAPRKVG